MELTKEILHKLYVEQGLSIRECAKILGRPTSGSISWWLRKFGIPPRPAGFQIGNRTKGDRKTETHGSWKGGKKSICCSSCGVTIHRFPSQIKRNNYCSNCKRKKGEDLTGQKFGLLTVIEQIGKDKNNHVQWFCKCECGGEKVEITNHLKSLRVTSCGCKRHLKGYNNKSWKGGKIEVRCANSDCNKTKFVYPGRLKKYTYFFCSEECKAAYRSRFIRGKNNPRHKEKIKVPCAYCGKLIEVYPHKVTTYKNQFCNGTDCISQWRKLRSAGSTNPNYHGGTPEMRKIRGRISAAMRKAIRGNKAGRRWESLVNYTMQELIDHLKSTVPEGYSWERDFINGKGILHIDHIKPMSSFKFETAEDEAFRKCFTLSNLQLLPASDNMRKGAKVNK